MSHWKAAKCDLKCSIDVMKRALINIFPSWEQAMQISAGGDLKIQNAYGKNRGFSQNEKEQGGFKIVVPGGGNYGRQGAVPELKYADLGCRQLADGTWEIIVDPSGHDYMSNMQDRVQGQIELMKAKAKAQKAGGKTIFFDTEDDGSTRAIIRLPLNDQGTMA